MLFLASSIPETSTILKLHFTATDEPQIEAIIKALEGGHEITQNPDTLTSNVDALVVGPNSAEEDPDVKAAKKHSIPIFGIGDLLYKLAEDKQRVVIAGSGDKAQIASIVIHVLQVVGKEFDYALWSTEHGSQVRLSSAPLIILEGSGEQNYYGDKRPQFLALNHHIAQITGLQHEFKDRYASFDAYVQEFDKLADATPKGGTVLYCEDDDLVTVIGGKERADVKSIPFSAHPGSADADGVAKLKTDSGEVMVKLSGEKTLDIIGAALALLKRLSVTEDQFYSAVKSYQPVQ